MDNRWLPDGHHWDLHIELPGGGRNAGFFTGGGWKFVVHTTEGGSVDSNVNLLRGGSTPHLVAGLEAGRSHWTVVQLLPFDVAGRALQNDTGDGFETNRANAIQVEIVGFTADIPNWPDVQYKRLANLFELVRHRVPIRRSAPLDFSGNVHRMTDREWVAAEGIVGHIHSPDNNHTDPFRFREGFFVDLVRNVPDGGYAL